CAFGVPQDEGGASHLQLGDADPAPLLPAPEPGPGERHALAAFEQRPFERRPLVEMADEDLPSGLEAVVVIIPTSGFHTARGAFARAWLRHFCSPATAEPKVPST